VTRPTAAEVGGGPGPGLVRLWAGWRSTYIARVNDDSAELRPDDAGRSLFERILAAPMSDEEALVVHRGARSSVLLNAFPYGSGHLLVVPNRAAPDLGDLDPDEQTDLWATVTAAVAAVRTAYAPDGVNVGLNLGRAAGGSIAEHLHVHVLPRWHGDANFMTSVASATTIPEALPVTAAKLRDAWGTV